MSAQDERGELQDTGEPTDPAGPTTASLAKSVRRLRIWLAVLSCVVGLGIVGGLALGILGVTSIAGGLGESSGVTPDQLSSVRKQIADAYGERAQNVVVRAIKVDSGAPFPVALYGGGNEQAIYVRYGLKGSPVQFSGIVGGLTGSDPAGSGMIPTQGSLTSRMTTAQLDGLLAAYAQQTTDPIGSVVRYGTDPTLAAADGPTAPSSVTVAGKTYKTADLWSATQGKVVKGDMFKLDDFMNVSTKAYIFYEDPKSGRFTFLGTEPVDSGI